MPLTRTNEQATGISGTKGLNALTALIGFFLWTPALGLPVGPMWLQPVDILIVLGYPTILAFLPQLPKKTALVILLSAASAFCAALNGGDFFILVYYLGFVTPFLLFIGVVASRPDTRKTFITFFALGGATSLALFTGLLVVGAENLDFRNNMTFGLPQQYKRGFGLFPEVSTFSTHLIYLLGVIIVFLRAQTVRRLFPFGRVSVLAVLVIICLLFTRSTSILVVAPAIVAVAYFKGRTLSLKGVVGAILVVAITTILLQVYIEVFYSERASAGGHRSIWLRGISILAGLSVLPNGEIFGVGLGNNHMITERAIETARTLGFSLILIPEGINSFVVTRIFEEGWSVVLPFGVAFSYLVVTCTVYQRDVYARAFVVLAVASAMVSLSVTGYRGIYMNWFWLAAASALMNQTKPQTQPISLKRFASYKT